MNVVEVGIGIVLRVPPNKHHIHVVNHPLEHEILITKRKPDTVFPNSWELPGGKAEPGETIDACVRRELFEEIGVTVEVLGSLTPVVHAYAHGTVRLHPRMCRLTPESAPPTNLQVADHRWSPLSRASEHAFPDANAAIMGELRSRLEAGAVWMPAAFPG